MLTRVWLAVACPQSRCRRSKWTTATSPQTSCPSQLPLPETTTHLRPRNNYNSNSSEVRLDLSTWSLFSSSSNIRTIPSEVMEATEVTASNSRASRLITISPTAFRTSTAVTATRTPTRIHPRADTEARAVTLRLRLLPRVTRCHPAAETSTNSNNNSTILSSSTRWRHHRPSLTRLRSTTRRPRSSGWPPQRMRSQERCLRPQQVNSDWG